MNDRIRIILEKYNLSARKFSDKMGIQASGVSHILSGRNKPGYDFIINVLNTFPEINPDWFLLGNGTIFRDGRSDLPELFDDNSTFEAKNDLNSDQNSIFTMDSDKDRASGTPISKSKQEAPSDHNCEEELNFQLKPVRSDLKQEKDAVATQRDVFNSEVSKKDVVTLKDDSVNSLNTPKSVKKIIILNTDMTFSIYNQEQV